MSNKTQLQNNNTQLASLIQELQGKATGEGGASIDTCTVVVKAMYDEEWLTNAFCGDYAVSVLENGKVNTLCVSGNTYRTVPFTVENVVCGTSFTCYFNSTYGCSVIPDNGERLDEYTSYVVVKVTENAGETTTINLYAPG